MTVFLSVTSALLWMVGVPLAACALYLFLLALLARHPRAGAAPAATGLRFDVIVPAHDEEVCIERTVRSLLAVDYPRDLFRLRVVADNCSDRTAELAAAAGAEVLVRQSDKERGKGYALAFAFARSQAEAFADAVVVVDADTEASPNLLAALGRELRRGAQAVQAEYGVLNRDDSWRTKLMALAFAIFHGVRSSARERLGLSAGLRGNGMAFTLKLLREVPHEAFSVVEDLEYGLRVGEAGYRVHYAGDAEVRGEMAASEQASRSQRERWEGGRLSMALAHAPRLIALGIGRGDKVLLDLAADLLVPPLSWLVLLSALGTAATGTLAVFGRAPAPVLALYLCTDAALAAYVLRGVRYAGLPFRTLAFAPAYVLWKVVMLVRRPAARRGEWVRTARERSP